MDQRAQGMLSRGVERRARGERGYALVEMAMSIVLLLTVIFAVMQFSFALYTYQLPFTTQPGRELATQSVTGGSACNSFATACPNASATNAPGLCPRTRVPWRSDPNKYDGDNDLAPHRAGVSCYRNALQGSGDLV